MRTLIIFIITILSLNINAQELTVKSFSLVSNDLTAQTYPSKDNNDINCALIKVQFVGDISNIEGNVVKPWVKKDNETWVYMTQRSRQMQIKTKDYMPLMVNFSDYGVPMLESNRTYVLTIVNPTNNVSNQKQILNIVYSPSNSSIIIDNEPLECSGGKVSVSLSVGKHDYIVYAKGYESENGSINLKATAPSKLNIELVKKGQNQPSPNLTISGSIASSAVGDTDENVPRLEGASEEVQDMWICSYIPWRKCKG